MRHDTTKGVLGLLLALVGSYGAGLSVAAAAPDPTALLARGECGRCHAVERLGLPAAPRARACSGCHQWIHASAGDPGATAEGRMRYPLWDRYVANVSTYLDVPDLASSAARLRTDFIAAYLRAPFQVRPALGEGMFRTSLSADEASALAAWLPTEARRHVTASSEARAAAGFPLSQAPEDVLAGAKLFASLGCATCHARGSARPSQSPPPVRGAPDLAFVARRMAPGDAAAYIADPSTFGAETAMPKYPLRPVEAARLRDFLWAEATAAPASAAAPPARNAVASSSATSPVAPGSAVVPAAATYANVRARVLDAVCVHCHMDPRKNHGDGGPGNMGGLGYRAAALDLQSWEGLRRGARDQHGRRVAILEAAPGRSTPPLLERLRRRVAEREGELAGRPLSPGSAPGMPLGLPALGADDLDLVTRWLAAGAPGPGGRPGRKLDRRHRGLLIARSRE